MIDPILMSTTEATDTEDTSQDQIINPSSLFRKKYFCATKPSKKYAFDATAIITHLSSLALYAAETQNYSTLKKIIEILLSSHQHLHSDLILHLISLLHSSTSSSSSSSSETSLDLIKIIQTYTREKKKTLVRIPLKSYIYYAIECSNIYCSLGKEKEAYACLEGLITNREMNKEIKYLVGSYLGKISYCIWFKSLVKKQNDNQGSENEGSDSSEVKLVEFLVDIEEEHRNHWYRLAKTHLKKSLKDNFILYVKILIAGGEESQEAALSLLKEREDLESCLIGFYLAKCLKVDCKGFVRGVLRADPFFKGDVYEEVGNDEEAFKVLLDVYYYDSDMEKRKWIYEYLVERKPEFAEVLDKLK